MKKQDKQDKLFKKAYVYGENAFFSANKNRKKSIRIYKKLALRYDDTSAMSNIALTYKDMYKFNKAKKWFKSRVYPKRWVFIFSLLSVLVSFCQTPISNLRGER